MERREGQEHEYRVYRRDEAEPPPPIRRRDDDHPDYEEQVDGA